LWNSPDVPLFFVGVEGDSYGKIIDTNQAFAGLLGYGTAELIGMTIGEITAEEDRLSTQAEFKRLANHEVDSIYQVKRYVRRNGKSYCDAQVWRWMLHDQEHRSSIVLSYVQLLPECESIEIRKRNQKVLATVQQLAAELHVLKGQVEALTGREGQDVTVHVGDGNHAGRDNNSRNDAAVIKYLVGAVIALALSVVWIMYYLMGGDEKPPTTPVPSAEMRVDQATGGGN
jgi:PAS domain S-box-containing protein